MMKFAGLLPAEREEMRQMMDTAFEIGQKSGARPRCLAQFPMSTGTVELIYPPGMAVEDLDALTDYFSVWMRSQRRLAALVEGVATTPTADGEASKPKARATEPKSISPTDCQTSGGEA